MATEVAIGISAGELSLKAAAVVEYVKVSVDARDSFALQPEAIALTYERIAGAVGAVVAVAAVDEETMTDPNVGAPI